MATKQNNKYINKATDDEELFILMGRDSTAPEVVLEWIKLNFRKQPVEKLREAFETAINLVYSEVQYTIMENARKARGEVQQVTFKIPNCTKIESRKDGKWIVQVECCDKQFIMMKAYEHQDSPPLRLTMPYPMYPMYGHEIVIVAKYGGSEGSVDIMPADLYDEVNPF